jgi:hypothetical protein
MYKNWPTIFEFSARKKMILRTRQEQKFGARNPKFETNSNDQKHNVRNNPNSDFSFLKFWVSLICFGFRYSEFGFVALIVGAANFLQALRNF